VPTSPAVKRSVWVRDAGCCAICRERVYLNASSSMPAQFRGEVAHIVAEQADGPRGSSSLASEERNQENNLLLLCFDHHSEIDSNEPQYPVERLQSIRADHSAWVADRLRLETPWQTKLHNFYYLNVPRLQVLSAMSGASLDLSRYGEFVALHELEWELGGLMAGYKRLLEKIELRSIPMVNALPRGPDARGWIVSFDTRFRTKNINMPQSTDGYKAAVRGDLRTDPHIYVKLNGKKVSLVINPRWITTSTAFVQFRPSSGQNQFAGLGIVNSVDGRSMSVTPLIIGLPSNPFIEAFYG